MIETSRWTFALAVLPLLALPAMSKPLPDWGLMLNDDGDYSFTSPDPQESARNLRLSIDALAGTPVKTLMYSVGAGSDVLYYPTKVASVWGWQRTSHDNDSDWGNRVRNIKAGMAAGVDPIRVAGEEAKRLGLFFVPSYRMNDDHFMTDTYDYPLTGEFWVKNGERLKIGDSPIIGHPDYGNLFDFSQEEVRDFRLRVIFEVIERYQDIMDGVELDFNRVQVLFPRGKARERAYLVTEMIERVRARLDDVGRRNGRSYALFVRVPPSLDNCHWAGLRIESWMRERLVDVLIPAQLMTLAHDMPIDEFVALAEPAGCKVYPALYPRTQYGWPFVAAPTAESYAAGAKREVTPELVRSAASNYWHMGAAGFQLFNFHHEDLGVRPHSDRLYRIVRDLARPECLLLANKEYAITPAYYLDYLDSYEYRKQIPVDLTPGVKRDLTLIVGDDLTDRTVAPVPATVALRLGLVGVSANTEMTVTVNGNVLHEGALGPRLTAVTGSRPAHSAHPPVAETYLQMPIADLSVLRQGRNAVTVALTGQPAGEAQLVEVVLGVIYDKRYLEML